jgi:hypothetical protein
MVTLKIWSHPLGKFKDKLLTLTPTLAWNMLLSPKCSTRSSGIKNIKNLTIRYCHPKVQLNSTIRLQETYL